MLNCAQQSLHRSAATILVLWAPLTMAACGVSSPKTPLPVIDHSQPVTLLDSKQKAKELEKLGRLADEQNQKAAKIAPITYKIPDSSP